MDSVKIVNLGVTFSGKEALKNIYLTVKKGEGIAITGGSGSGKSLLANVLAGLVTPSSGAFTASVLPEKIAYVPQQHDFRRYFSSRSYYQQRFDHNYGTTSPIVRELLTKLFPLHSEEEIHQKASELAIDYALKKRLVELSNGEGKRIHLLMALIDEPELLILDAPFTGLDVHFRETLNRLLNKLIQEGLTLILVTSKEAIPEEFSRVITLEKGEIHSIRPLNDYLKVRNQAVTSFTIPAEKLHDLKFPDDEGFSYALRMEDVQVRYGEKKILEQVDWEVKRGERWALSGANGAGKTTLLSLINGDNPQVYSNKVWLFDRRRGSGESIWDIKQKIGYISPELHLYFQKDLSFTENLSATYSDFAIPALNCFDAAASGFKEQIGGTRDISSFQKFQIDKWFEILGVESLKKESFFKISPGQQRLILLARALVKNPPLLILDEPCQGLDPEQTHLFIAVVNQIATYFNKTLIYVSHYQEEIPECVENLLILEGGKIKFKGERNRT